MPNTGSTGQGSTVTLAGVTGCVRSIQLNEMTLETIDVSCLADTGFMKKIASDLVDAGEVTITTVWDGSAPTPDTSQTTLTVIVPDGSGAGTTTTISGSGYITGSSLPTAEGGTLMESSVTFTFDGDTGPSVAATV